MTKKNQHIRSSIDDLMKEEGWYEKAEEQAIKEVIAWQLSQAMEKERISKSAMAIDGTSPAFPLSHRRIL
jgi:hypothetical protein